MLVVPGVDLYKQLHSWKRDSWLLYKNSIVAVCVLFLFFMGHWIGLKSVIMAFPSYTQLLCITEIFFIFPLQGTSKTVSLKVDQSVSILKLLW